MFLDEASYFARRAASQLECASSAADHAVARVHAQLSNLYLERARVLVSRAVSDGWTDNVVPLKATA